MNNENSTSANEVELTENKQSAEEQLAEEQLATEKATEKDAVVIEIEDAEEDAEETAEGASAKKTKRGSRGGANAKKTKQLEAEFEALEKEIVAVESERNELKDKYLRLFAEFDNYKKRTARERLDILKTASSDIIRELIPILDDFERAKSVSDDGFSEGVQLIYDKLVSNLTKKGLTPMDSTGEPFDVELHEAITEIPAPTEEMKGKVIDTIERGYKLNDKIIRYAKVVVGK